MKNAMNPLKGVLAASAFLFFIQQAPGQSYTDSLAQDDHDIISSIAPYPEDVRAAILEVSQYPQVLVKLERVQSRSSQSFQDLIASYPREEQEKFYELSRFPDLVSQLATHTSLNPDEVRPLMKDYPAESQTRMLEVYTAHFKDLVKMNDLYQKSQAALKNVTSSYPPDIQAAFQKVVSIPDVMNLLTDNIDLTVSLGESYKSDPNGIKQQLDSLNAKLTEQNATDLAAYKKEVESDPKMQDEMKQAATEFSTQYDQPDDPNYVANNSYDNYPYPYWFSYPYWYPSPIWYPRPFWYHTGFYYGPGGGLVVVGLPSRVYSGWFFGAGYRHFPTLYSHYNSYYNFHRANIYNRNVYRGFNHAAHDHFVRNNRGAAGRAPARVENHAVNNAAINRSHAQVRSNQMNVHQNNFNNRGLQNFHAQTYHSMGWSNVGSHSSGGGGGGFRSSGGGGGGFHGGGGGGGGHGRH
jgi:hypothetical protein